MIIDKVNIKKFWAAQAKKADIADESIANLEEDEELLKKKILFEKKKILPIVKSYLNNESKVLDLGSGTGQWAYRFSPFADSITLVEFSKEMMTLAKRNSKDKIYNFKFIVCEAQDFLSDELYELIWISGLLIYLNDQELARLIKNCKKMLSPGGCLILRDGTGLKERHEINNQFSETLNHNYSATYRTAKEYITEFHKGGFELVNHSDLFETGSELNKWKETRLRLYQFK